jgi:hypothetical protein
MVLGPGWPQRCPRSLQDLVGPPTQHPARLTDHCLRVIPVDLPATSVGELGELLAVHDRVGSGLVGWATLDGDVLGEVQRPGPQRDRVDRHEQRGCELVKRSRRRPPDRCSHLRHQSGSSGHIQASALIVDGSRRHAGFDQLDPSTVHHRMAPRRRDRYGPAEMIRNAQVHKVTAWLKGRAVLEGHPGHHWLPWRAQGRVSGVGVRHVKAPRPFVTPVRSDRLAGVLIHRRPTPRQRV